MTSKEECVKSIQRWLKIPSEYLIYSETEQCLHILVHQTWLQYLLEKRNAPQSYSQELSSNEILNSLHIYSPTLPQGWLRILVQVHPKENGQVYKTLSRKVSSTSDTNIQLLSGLSGSNLDYSSNVLPFSQLLNSIVCKNSSNLLKDALLKHSAHQTSIQATEITPPKTISYNEAFLDVCSRLLACPVITLRSNSSTTSDSSLNASIVNYSVQSICLLDCDDCFIILFSAPAHSVRHCVNFSPQKLLKEPSVSNFLLHQLLQYCSDCHQRGVFVGDIGLSDLLLDQSMSLSVSPNFRASLFMSQSHTRVESKESSAQCEGGGYFSLVTNAEALRVLKTVNQKGLHKNENSSRNSLIYLTQLWCYRRLSNFDYLLCLAFFAGREFNSPKYHPTLPWVIDFSHRDLPLRDLTKTKFRLTKGDQQLDQTYAMSLNAGSKEVPPHHITESFSELSYHLYKARITCKEVLRQTVRQEWVPGQYPGSIMRLYQTTPDECIPEFYCDSSLFKSIHSDLEDLQIPSEYQGDYNQFLKRHREMLECEEVTSQLHHWIDLNYGYKLTGSSAMKAKNVLLELVSEKISLSRGGVCQLFNIPHPTVLRDQVEGLNSLTINSKVRNEREGSGAKTTKEGSVISMPSRYNPVSALNHFEVFYNFVLKTTGKFPDESLMNSKEFNERNHVEQLMKIRRWRDMLAITCCMVEIFVGQKSRLLGPRAQLEDRYSFCYSLIKTNCPDIPRTLRPLIRMIMQTSNSLSDDIKDSYTAPLTEMGLPPPSPSLLLQPLVDLLPFPPSYHKISNFVCTLRMLKSKSEFASLLISDQISKQDLTMKYADMQLKYAAAKLSSFECREDLTIVLPFYIELYNYPPTAVNAAYYLTSPLVQGLGPVASKTHLLPLIVKLYQLDCVSEKHLKLFHRSFLLHLIVWFGLETFLNYFIIPLIEGVGGYKEISMLGGSSSPDGAKSLNSIDLNHSEEISNVDLSETLSSKSHVDAFSEREAQSGLLNLSSVTTPQDSDQEVFLFEDNDLDDFTPSHNLRSASESESFEDLVPSTNETFNTQEYEDSDSDSATPHGNDFHNDMQSSPSLSENDESRKHVMTSNSLPNFSEMQNKFEKSEDSFNNTKTESVNRSGRSDGSNLSDVCCESVLWLSHRLGPVLTAKYLTRNLLRMLTLCYLPDRNALCPSAPHPQFDYRSVTQKKVRGDVTARRVLDCLSEVLVLYGEQVALVQYMGHIVELISSAAKNTRFSSTTEAGLMGAISLLEFLIPQLSDSIFMSSLKDNLIKGAVYPVIRLLSSTKVSFTHGVEIRTALAYRIVDILYIMSLRVGREMSKRIVMRSIQRLLSVFDKVYSPKSKEESSSPFTPPTYRENTVDSIRSKALLELKEVLTPEFAYLSYYPFCRFFGARTMENTLVTLHELLHSLCIQHDDNIQNSEACKLSSLSRTSDCGSNSESGERSPAIVVTGNRIDLSNIESPDKPPKPIGMLNTVNVSSLVKKCLSPEQSRRHLKGNWLAYWNHEIGRSELDNTFNLNHIKLMSFVGHTNSVKSLLALDNENSFVSCSKDKTVKLWSLRSEGDGSYQAQSQFTYTSHKKSVFNITFCERERLLASCDSTVHVWDPFIGSTVRQFDAIKHSAVTVLTNAPSPSSHLIVATTDGNLRVLDLRVKDYTHQYKVCMSGAGLVRSLVCGGEHLMCVSHSSGVAAVLDMRTGTLLSTSKPHEGEILAVKWYKDYTFISSALDQTIAVWSASDTSTKYLLKSPNEPVHLLQLYQDQLLSANTANKFGHHVSVQRDAHFTCSRLRSESIKGSLTAMELMPLNRMLLVASDTGAIRLLC